MNLPITVKHKNERFYVELNIFNYECYKLKASIEWYQLIMHRDVVIHFVWISWIVSTSIFAIIILF